MKQRIVPTLIALSVALWVVWLVVPHARWLDKEDLPYLDLVRGDLERVVQAQDSFFAAHAHYAHSLDSLGIQPGPDETIEITEATGSGFAATGSNARAFGDCGVFVGSASPPTRKMTEREARCW